MALPMLPPLFPLLPPPEAGGGAGMFVLAPSEDPSELSRFGCGGSSGCSGLTSCGVSLNQGQADNARNVM